MFLSNWRNLFFFVAFVLVSFTTFGQDLHWVYLKNGSKIKGFLTQKDTLADLVIYSADGNSFEFSWEIIDSVVKVKPPKPVPVKTSKSQLEQLSYGQKKFYAAFKGGVLPNGHYSLYGSVGLRFKSQVFLGVGSGYESYRDIQYGIIPNYATNIKHASDGMVPLYLDVRFFLMEGRTAMFLFTQLGWTFLPKTGDWYGRDSTQLGTQLLNRTTRGGALATFGFGLKFKLTKETDMFFDLGLKLQNYTNEVSENTYNIVTNSMQFYRSSYDRTALLPVWNLGVLF